MTMFRAVSYEQDCRLRNCVCCLVRDPGFVKEGSWGDASVCSRGRDAIDAEWSGLIPGHILGQMRD